MDSSPDSLGTGSRRPDLRRGILVVDDEQVVLRLMALGLSREGFDVFAASNGRQALELFESHRSEICVLVTDLNMPRMTGLQLIEQVQVAEPHPQIVACSGEAALLHQVSDRWGATVATLAKPYHMNELRAAVSAACERIPPAAAAE